LRHTAIATTIRGPEIIMTAVEPEIIVRSREELLYLLAEAAEIEHNLMCCYLFAAFGLKTGDDGLSEVDAARIASWGRAIAAVAVEEMAHLSLVANLTMAVGAAPHFGRPNFPVAAGYHPSGVVVELKRFDRATLDHFIYLERPEGVVLPDGAGFAATVSNYHRENAGGRLMPSAQDYLTVGHLYRGIRHGFVTLAAKLGEPGLFVGDPALQVGPELATLPGLTKVTDLASALAALDTIVEQGEGSSADATHSHYRRFIAIRDEYAAWLAREPGFEPSRPIAPNPVMRRPPQPDGKTYVDHPGTAPVMDLANAVYAAMMRTLAQGFVETDAARKRRFFDAAIDSMFALRPIAEHLTRLPASASQNGLTAGMSFATLRDFGAWPAGVAPEERFRELSAGAAQVLGANPIAATVVPALAAVARHLAGEAPAPPAPAIETAEGKDIIIDFETKRCIHARFCVLQQPGVFKANVVGPWLAPDDATSAEGLVAAAQNCPSGAVRYRRKDGGPQEGPPPVNLIRVRANGPLAVHAAIMMDGRAAGFRATLCRCGQSKNKPLCDGSHVAAAFAATGEPKTGDVTALARRDGALEIRPQKNGPLAIHGSVEVISGTGRAVRRAEDLMLCRCGGSANKPYCDGTHARIGFTTQG
jgi:CDGSH-type Zn-finger protein/uncharacterized Fe-S cluster protein YjdI